MDSTGFLLNEYQTPIEELHLKDKPKEIQDQFWDFFTNVPLIRWLTSADRPRAKDLPRDEEGKIIVDVTQPHILEDMDYFRPTAIHYQQTGRFTDLRPNPNPNSEYSKWVKEEVRRCWDGYVRPSDGEWITGDHYYFLNYFPILQSVETNKEALENVIMEEAKKKRKKSTGKRKTKRLSDFPLVWEGHYLKFHYIYQARETGHHGMELASRSKGKSYTGAALLSKRFNLGEDYDVRKEVQCVVTAYERKYLTGANQILDMFKKNIDFIATNTEWPSKKLINSTQQLQWKMGYKDLDKDAEVGTLNSVIGITSKDDESKLRGSRGVLYLVEEMGSFPRLLGLYSTMRPSVEDGEDVFGLIYIYGTAGDEASDFAAAQEIMYNPLGYNMLALKNVYDKEGQGKSLFTFFFPGYINRAGCYDKDGNSDVTKALLEIIEDRYTVKYNSSDVKTLTKRVAEIPITPQEAIMRTRGNLFPVTELTDRLNQIDNNSSEYDDVLVGKLVPDGEYMKFVPTTDIPIRHYPLQDNKNVGAIEIFKLPENDSSGKPMYGRYIVGHDPVDDDESHTMSLTSTFVLDLFTDQIVAEYTGRQGLADDNFEIVRRLCIFYNALCLYEAHPYDQIVRLPDGTTTTWEHIKVGDSLFAPNGRTVKVIDIPVDGEDNIYKVTFADGRSVEASSNHIWSVYEYPKRYNLVNRTTEQMFNSGVINKYGQKKYFVPEANAVEYSHKDVPIDPYTLGLLIAEGALTKFKKQNLKNKKRRTVQISAGNTDAEFYKTIIPYEMKHVGNIGVAWHLYIDDIDKKLDELGLLHHDSSTKFIPELYLFNDYNTRLELLKGLMDGDGCAVSKGASIFITTSEQLSKDVTLLCRSLGIKVTIQKEREAQSMFFSNSGNVYDCKTVYRLAISATILIFKLPRKVEKQHIYNPKAKGSKAQGIIYRNGISKIEYVGKKRCKCVTVDAEDGLYLIGDYVVTHNCNKKGLYAYFNQKRCSYLLADTPDYLKDKDLIKEIGTGNKQKGVNATQPINNYANKLIREWLLKPYTTTKTLDKTDEDGKVTQQDYEVTELNLYRLRNRALIEELIAFNPIGNYDRIRALGMVMLYREKFMIDYEGDVAGNAKQDRHTPTIADDDFFKSLYDDRLPLMNNQKDFYNY